MLPEVASEEKHLPQTFQMLKILGGEKAQKDRQALKWRGEEEHGLFNTLVFQGEGRWRKSTCGWMKSSQGHVGTGKGLPGP